MSTSSMFKQRTSSQKPSHAMLDSFQQSFPHVNCTPVSSTSTNAGAVAAHDAAYMSQTQGYNHEDAGHDEYIHDQDPTPRASVPFKFSQDWIDPTQQSFYSFTNPTGFMPTPGSNDAMIHSQEAGDLATPGVGLGMALATPLSMPTSENAIQSGPGIMDMSHLMMTNQAQYQQQSPFNNHPFIQPAQTTYNPAQLFHSDTGYETMDQDGSPLSSGNGGPERLGSMDAAFQQQVNPMPFQEQAHNPIGSAATIVPPNAKNFRFATTLNAATAMLKDAQDIPMSYLNKGQAYTLSIRDTAPALPYRPGTRFRTFVRVSFEEQEQRVKPAHCWGLWKEGRGTKEAPHRNGKLLAVEYVEQSQPHDGDERYPRMEIETASFDGFSVIWTPPPNAPIHECQISLRFNFLSTDFSHSKGVKGIPLRLCAKTTVLQPPGPAPTSDVMEEVCYCIVKLFRDHGAERKLANDNAHIKKLLEKARLQLEQQQNGVKDVGKRKRGGVSKGSVLQGPGKAVKHKRTWSMSSASSAGGGGGGGSGKSPVEEDLQTKCQTLDAMFSSTRAISVFWFAGEPQDDPDLHPVRIPGGDIADIKQEPQGTPATSSLVSPSPSNQSIPSQQPGSTGMIQYSPSTQVVQVQRKGEDGDVMGIINATGVDPTYQPPVERRPKPIACFYMALKTPETDGPDIHRAIYLRARTLAHMLDQICTKWSLDREKVVRCVRILDERLRVTMDDDVVCEMPEGLDMVLEIAEVDGDELQSKRAWDMSLDHPDSDQTATTTMPQNQGYELQFHF